jgi:hypothetical protein
MKQSLLLDQEDIGDVRVHLNLTVQRICQFEGFRAADTRSMDHWESLFSAVWVQLPRTLPPEKVLRDAVRPKSEIFWKTAAGGL